MLCDMVCGLVWDGVWCCVGIYAYDGMGEVILAVWYVQVGFKMSTVMVLYMS